MPKRFESKDVTDQGCQYVNDRAFFKQIDWVGDERVKRLIITWNIFNAVRTTLIKFEIC